MKLQTQYDLIYSLFKTTNEPFDELDWDGNELSIILSQGIIEYYTKKNLEVIIPNYK